ncbi:cyclic nucleotide-binding domain-containing protein [Nodosilinea sp. LEGE 06152]|uniref:cyclic nucleotide-binding domain-containing protein n=1 Tax=Nodosilinea sp. LEGE 06152 TaxID=2777966 RepID=UPI00188189BF|nr:cyclic nucleotide-binding domain-containing protein [Nodosilinea sp. LEGE 06152]MBE9160340.1 cyclic nucleotide-binding domain-containing protein [Nodosilinea sp. LEGE 06152]
MTDTLLRVLSNADLDWMIAHGEHQPLTTGQSVLHPHRVPDRISLVIDGSLGESAATQGAVDEAVLIDELGQGELVGVSPLLNAPNLTAVKALKSTLMLSLPIAQVQLKLAEDVAFAAHFYHAIALQLADRLRRIFEQPDRVRWANERTGNDVLTVFGELRDSDIDWLTSFGQIETIPAGRVLLQAGRPVESLTILLDGQLAMSAPQDTFNPLALCFLGLEHSTRGQSAFATLSQGSMPGIISFLDFRPLPVTVRSLGEALVFAVPRFTLATKLQVDDSFASRFYRVVAMQIMEQLQTVGMRLMEPGAEANLDDELDMDDLNQVSEGAKKFSWMLAQLGVNGRG